MTSKMSADRLNEIYKVVSESKSRSEAAYKLGIAVSTLQYHLARLEALGRPLKKGYAPTRAGTEKSDPGPDPDPIEVRRLKDRVHLEASARKHAERRAATDKTIREAVFRLAAEPLRPPSWMPVIPKKTDKIGEVIILMLSDLHMGEIIDLSQMGGVNAFSEKIARERIRRLFEGFVKLATVHWSGPPPSAIYVLLMGDLVSGEIHDELAKTNDLLSIPAVRAVSEAIIGGLDMLLREFQKIPFHVISVPGNHGRTTRKPESKGFAVDSYDTLVAWVVESWYAAKGHKRITFSAPASGDALLNIFGWSVLVTHGDRIGSRGGAGFVGPAATISRGFQKCIMDYASQGVIIDIILVGHFHSSMELSQGFCNGCLSGPSEYSKSGRMRPEPASQWMLSIHPNRGVARRWKILCGDQSEGSIYRGRA